MLQDHNSGLVKLTSERPTCIGVEDVVVREFFAIELLSVNQRNAA